MLHWPFGILYVECMGSWPLFGQKRCDGTCALSHAGSMRCGGAVGRVMNVCLVNGRQCCAPGGTRAEVSARRRGEFNDGCKNYKVLMACRYVCEVSATLRAKMEDMRC